MNDVFKVSTFYVYFFKSLWEKRAQMNFFPFITLYVVYFIGQFNERVL
jgi:hypothetical protein